MGGTMRLISVTAFVLALGSGTTLGQEPAQYALDISEEAPPRVFDHSTQVELPLQITDTAERPADCPEEGFWAAIPAYSSSSNFVAAIQTGNTLIARCADGKQFQLTGGAESYARISSQYIRYELKPKPDEGDLTDHGGPRGAQ